MAVFLGSLISALAPSVVLAEPPQTRAARINITVSYFVRTTLCAQPMAIKRFTSAPRPSRNYCD